MPRHPTLIAVIAAALLGAMADSSFANEGTDGAAGDAAAKGLAIAREADRRDEGFGDSQATMRMTLRNSRGDERTRQMRSQTLEVASGGDKNLIVFEDPADVKGTALLTFTYTDKPDDQWLYLPALKRVKRINSKNKSGPFMGSEFAYEDLSSQEVEKYQYKYLGEDTVDGVATFKVEQYPQYEHSGYKRLIVWYNADNYRPEKIVFYDRKDSLLKTLSYEGYKQYLDKFWRADQSTMINHQNGKSTVLTWSDYQFGNGLTDRDFHKNVLKRAR